MTRYIPEILVPELYDEEVYAQEQEAEIVIVEESSPVINGELIYKGVWKDEIRPTLQYSDCSTPGCMGVRMLVRGIPFRLLTRDGDPILVFDSEDESRKIRLHPHLNSDLVFCYGTEKPGPDSDIFLLSKWSDSVFSRAIFMSPYLRAIWTAHACDFCVGVARRYIGEKRFARLVEAGESLTDPAGNPAGNPETTSGEGGTHG